MIGRWLRDLMAQTALLDAEEALTGILVKHITSISEKAQGAEPAARAAYWDSVLMLLDQMRESLGVERSIDHDGLRELVLQMHVDLTEKEH